MTADQIVFTAIVLATLAMFISERIRIDVAAMVTLLALAFTGILTPGEALSGFASEPAIIVASVFVISAALSATGLTERIGDFIARAAGAREWRAILIIMPCVAMLAALSHHLMVTAMMLPILMRLARTQKLPASRLLMPMSLSASIGTTLTLFSAPAFLLTNNMLKEQGGEGLDVFAITPIGAALVLLAILYMSLGRWLLPRRGSGGGEMDYLQLDRYYTELVIRKDSQWIGKSFAQFDAHVSKRLSIVDWMRNDVSQRESAGDAPLAAGDVFIIRASSDEIASLNDEPGVQLHAIAKYGETARKTGSMTEEHQLVQVVVAPHSQFVGSTIGDIDFLKAFGVVVVGLWRRDGWMREEISQVKLHEGDLLVLWGAPHTFSELSSNRGFLMMVPFAANARKRHRATLAAGITALVVAAAAAEFIPTQLAFLAGAVALIVTRCVSVEQAYREIDVRIFVMIAGVIPLGAAMQKTGTAALFADHLQQLTAGWEVFAVLLALFWAGALLTQILSDSATVVLLGPISLALAVALGQPPEPFVVCTALGAVVAFLTPIGHHGNLLILNPGRYTFGDFLRVGVPLTVFISLVSAWMAQYLWLDGPLIPTQLPF